MGVLGAAGAAGAVAPGTGWAAPRLPSGRSAESLVKAASATRAAGGDLGAVEHVVFLMMENRSYDHYFGAYPKGRGFDDHPKHSLGAFEQVYPAGKKLSPSKRLLPFEIEHAAYQDCTKDLTHDWGPMHQCWNNGKMDHFVKVHTSKSNEGSPDGALTMGYYTRKELGFYWALADHFTLADRYHSSILGPTHPNRLMAISGTIDPAGKQGGPITDTSGAQSNYWSCTWETMPEVLEDHGVSWKVYHPSNANVDGTGYANLASYPTWDPNVYAPNTALTITDHVLPYFKNYEDPNSTLYQKAFNPTFPGDFVNDVAADNLPAVSWLIPPLGFDEHPSSPPAQGMYFTQLVLDALTANKKVWSKTVLFLMYDENDGWFDHVPPPTAPKGTAGEWLTAKTISSETDGIRGPLGLGVRVPCLAISPFARGGNIAGHVFDHTSQLHLLKERWGVPVPNVSEWRRHHVGDLSLMLFRNQPDASMPALPTVKTPPAKLSGNCASSDYELGGAGPKIPTKQRMPTQHGTTEPPPRKHKTGKHAAGGPDVVPVDHANRGPRSSTRKAAYNALAEGRAVPPPS
jgi:phospholipase C